MNPLIQAAGAYYRVRLVFAIVWRYAAMVAAVFGLLWLTGCATMHKQGITQDEANKDHYECERDAFNSHAQGLVLNALYRDCMRARGYK